MSIRVVCQGCNRGITAGDKFAGKVASCSSCGKPVNIPATFDVDAFITSALPPPTQASPPLARPDPLKLPKLEVPIADFVDCPFCGEQIKANARKCRHCGEFLDEELRSEEKHAASSHQTIVVAPAQTSPGIAALLSLIIPGAGQMYQNKVGQGLLWFVAVGIGYAMFIVPGLVLHLV